MNRIEWKMIVITLMMQILLSYYRLSYVNLVKLMEIKMLNSHLSDRAPSHEKSEEMLSVEKNAVNLNFLKSLGLFILTAW